MSLNKSEIQLKILDPNQIQIKHVHMQFIFLIWNTFLVLEETMVKPKGERTCGKQELFYSENS